jgi:hypothetical protein
MLAYHLKEDVWHFTPCVLHYFLYHLGLGMLKQGEVSRSKKHRGFLILFKLYQLLIINFLQALLQLP